MSLFVKNNVIIIPEPRVVMDSESQRSSSASGRTQRKAEAEKCSIMGYKEYLDYFYDIDTSKPLYIFYTGTKSPTSGYSWCPVCVEAGRILEQYVAEHPEIVFLSVHVGSQDEWEDTSNPFKTNKDINLRTVPTLLKYNSQNRRLEGHYCLRRELLDLLFQEDWDF